MIGKLVGILDSVDEGCIILNVAGVGYRVFVSNRLISVLPSVGEGVSLFIQTHVREDHIHLFGFLDKVEQTVFNILTTVPGVGVKVALGILGALSADAIKLSIVSEDAKAFTKVSGIGPKLATRITNELKSKMGAISMASDNMINEMPAIDMNNTLLNDSVSAFINLGYTKAEAGLMANRILKENPDASLGDLIRLALKELGAKNG